MGDVRAVIFDYYGTLAELGPETRSSMFDNVAARSGAGLQPGDAYADWRRRITNDATVRFGGELPPLEGPVPAFRSFREVWTARFAELFELWRVAAPAALGADAYVETHAAAPAYPDVLPALDVLAGRYRLAVLSDADSDFLNPSVRNNGIAFEAVVSSEDLRAYKPHISTFQAVCSQLAIEPREAVYVGDNPRSDIVGARNAGMRAIWINRHDATWPSEYDLPEATVRSLANLAALLG